MAENPGSHDHVLPKSTRKFCATSSSTGNRLVSPPSDKIVSPPSDKNCKAGSCCFAYEVYSCELPILVNN